MKNFMKKIHTTVNEISPFPIEKVVPWVRRSVVVGIYNEWVKMWIEADRYGNKKVAGGQNSWIHLTNEILLRDIKNSDRTRWSACFLWYVIYQLWFWWKSDSSLCYKVRLYKGKHCNRSEEVESHRKEFAFSWRI